MTYPHAKRLVKRAVRLAVYTAFASVGVLSSSQVARAQCFDWSSGFEVPGFTLPASESSLNALEVYDDGTGPALYAAGEFSTVGTTTVSALAKWTGQDWSALGTGLGGSGLVVLDLAVYDGGSGPELIAAGRIATAGGGGVSNIAKWNGTSWSALGAGLSGVFFPQVMHMAVFDDGSGPALFVCGDFTMAGGAAASNLAKWNGTSWSSFGSSSPGILTLAVFDNGAGARLYAGGYFNTIGGISADGLAKWNGVAWSAVAAFPNGTITALTTFDDGAGDALYLSGNFNVIGGVSANRIASWDGGSGWSALGTGLNGQANDFATFDDGSGPALFVAGQFTTAGGASANRVAKWDGVNWSALGSGFNANLSSLAVFDDGSGIGPRLCAAGSFSSSGDSAVNHFARWDGSTWSLPSYGQGIDQEGFTQTQNIDQGVRCLATYDDGEGPRLYAGGRFEGAGRLATHGIARWERAHWNALQDGIAGEVNALQVFDDGSGDALYAGGDFLIASGVTVNHIARWNGTSWSALGNGFNYPVFDLTVFDDGTGAALYAAGQFTSTPSLLLKRVAKWNGSTWSAVGNGTSGNVTALAVYDDGSGNALYAGGLFTDASGTSASNIAKWNGSTWSALGAGTNNQVYALTVFDDGLGSGPLLYAGGLFTLAGGGSALRIARWNGIAWSAVGTGMSSRVDDLHVFDDGAGARLYAGGAFNTAGGNAADRVAQWNGSAWSALGSGINGTVAALADYDDGSGGGPELYVGGNFTTAGGKPSTHIARYGACRPGLEYCFGDDNDPYVAIDCPCGNTGKPGHGCANSNPSLGGAHLTATGTTSPNTVLFTCNGIPNNTLCTFFRTVATANSGSVYGDGIRCLFGSGIRFGQQNSGQNGNPANTVTAGAPTIAPGFTRYYQVQYRNPAAFCTSATFNASNGYTISW